MLLSTLRGDSVVDASFVVVPQCFGCVWSVFCDVVSNVHSSFAFIWRRKKGRELVKKF